MVKEQSNRVIEGLYVFMLTSRKKEQYAGNWNRSRAY